MAAFDPRMFQMHAGLHANAMNNTPPRYPQQTTNSMHGQPAAPVTQQRAGSSSSDSRPKSGPGWENTYRTAQNIGFPDTRLTFGETTGEFLEELARGIGCPVEFVLVPLLSCVGSLLGTNTSIRVHKSWSEPPVIWTVVGANAGSRRSAVVRQLLSPILTLQAEVQTSDNRSGEGGEDISATSSKLLEQNGDLDTSPVTSHAKKRQRRALYSGNRLTLAMLTENLQRNFGHAFCVTENVENLHENLMQPMTSTKLMSIMEDLYEGLPLVTVEDGKVTTLPGSCFCYGGFARPEYVVSLMLKSPPWLSARLLLVCPQSDDMKGVFGEATASRDLPELVQIYSTLLDQHKTRSVYVFDRDAVQELSRFFDEEWSTVLNQLDQNEHEGIIGKSMGQIVRLCGILKALDNSIYSAMESCINKEPKWDWTIERGTVIKAITLGKYFLEQKLAMTFMVGTGFFNQSPAISCDPNGSMDNVTTLPQTAIQDIKQQQISFFSPQPNSAPPISHPTTPRTSFQENSNISLNSLQQTPNSAFPLVKQIGDVDFSNLPQTMTTAEEDVSEMMQAVDFVHLSKTQFVAVHGRRIKRLLECYDDGHGVSATTAAQKSITPPVRIEGTNNRHPAWASALFFQKVADLELGKAEQGRHPTNRKVCWRFKRKPVNELLEKDLQLLHYLRVEMDKYSQFGPGPFNPNMLVNSSLMAMPAMNNSSPRQMGSSPLDGRIDDDSNSQNSSRNSMTPTIKTEIF
ncbi:uncharacterized protein LOC131935932 isoform X2 [Physella acuta]|nr:uncharacterized protein LOC131935932 isoform X2 [Physella acuta]